MPLHTHSYWLRIFASKDHHGAFNKSLKIAIALLMIMGAVSVCLGADTPDVEMQGSEAFIVYDGLLNTIEGKPDLSRYGVRKIVTIYDQELWPARDPQTNPNPQQIKKAARKAFGRSDDALVVLDVEHWELDERQAPLKNVTVNIGKMLGVFDAFKGSFPLAKVGFYGETPIRDYWSPVANDQAKIMAWHQANDRLQTISAKVDVIFPSLYTFYENRAGWVKYAQANIQEAKRSAPGKPIIAYLWPEYHPAGTRAKQLIEYDYWLLQLETLYAAQIQGVVIWGAPEKKWNKEAGWWRATKDFLKKIKTPQRNKIPVVDAGMDQSIPSGVLNFGLHGSYDDQDTRNTALQGHKYSKTRWMQLDGPSKAKIADPEKLATKVTVQCPGMYEFGLMGSDGQFSAYDSTNIAVVSEAPIARYNFGYATGIVVPDDGYYKNDLLVIGMKSPKKRAMKSGTFGMLFNGVNQYGYLPESSFANFGATNFSITALVKFSSNPHQTSTSTIVGRSTPGVCCQPNGYPGFFLGREGDSLNFRLEDEAIGIQRAAVSAKIPKGATDLLHVVALRRDNDLELYLDGKLAGQAKNVVLNSYSVNSLAPVGIGAQNPDTATGFFKGTIGKVSFYNRALDPAEITQVSVAKDLL